MRAASPRSRSAADDSPRRCCRPAPGYSGSRLVAELQRQAAAARDLHRVGQRLGHVGEQLGHLLRRAQVLLRACSGARAPASASSAPLVDADARLVRFEIARPAGSARRWSPPPARRARAASATARGDVRLLVGAARGAAARGRSDRRTAPASASSARSASALAAVDERAADIAFRAPDSAISPREVLARQPAALDQRRACRCAFEIRAAHQPREVPVADLRSGTAASGATAPARSPASRTSRSTPMIGLHARARAPRGRTSPSRTGCSGR